MAQSQVPWQFRGQPQRSKSGQWPNSWNSHPFPQIAGILLLLISLRNYPPLSNPPVGFPGGSEVKASACNAGDLGSIPGSGRSPGEGNGNPLQYSCLENPMDRRAYGLQSTGSQRVGHDWSDSAHTHVFSCILVSNSWGHGLLRKNVWS